MKKQMVVGLALFGLMISVFFQNCSRPVSFQESAPMDFASLSVSGLLINNGDTYTNNSIVSLTLDVGNAADMYVTNSPDCSSGGVWVPATEQLSWELNSLNSETAVYAKFRSTYQKESPCMSDTIIHDNIAPVISLQSALPPKTNQASTSIGLATADAGSGVEKVFCPASIASCSNSVSSANTADGVKSFSFYVTDRAGNRSADLVVSYLVDRTAPTLLINQQPPVRTGSQTANFVFSGSDQYSAVTFKCSMNGGAYILCPSNYSIGGLGEGDHSMNIVAVDDLGNTSAPQNAAWSVSRNLPTVVITKSPALYTNQKGSFEFNGKDQFGAALTLFQCKLNADSWKPCSSPYDLSALSLIQGLNSFRVRGTDSEGLVSGEELSQWTYDTALPVLSFVSKPAAFTNKVNENAVVAVANNEVVELDFKLDGASLTTSVPGSFAFNPSESAHAIVVVATDRAGNKSAELKASFVSDFTNPTLTFPDSAFPNLSSPMASSTLRFQVVAVDTNTAAGNTLSTFYSLSELANASTSTDNFILFVSPVNLTTLKTGSHQIKFHAKDAAGNQSVDYVSTSFLVDLFPPLISFIGQPPPNVRPGSTQTFNYLVQDNDSGLLSAKCKLTINGALIYDQACDPVAIYNLPVTQEGVFVFTITAVDIVGNTSTKSVSFVSVELFKAQSKTFNVSALHNNKVDVLFVMDGSHTMRPEYERIASAFSSFINNLGSINYRIALTTTDNAWGGTLLTLGTRTYIDSTVSNGLALLQEGLQRKTNQSGDEVGLTAIQGFIDRAKVNTTPEYAFYRSDAVLATVIITDDDEAAHGGYQSADQFLSDLNGKLPDKVYINHSSIVLPNDANCLRDQGANYGVTYYEASRLSGGISVSICSADYGNQLKDFATSIIARVSEQTLQCNPIDQNSDGVIDISISHTSDGVTTTLAPSSYSVLGNRVRFASPLTGLGDYTINFFCVQ